MPFKDNRPPLLVIVGPTAVGKTELSLRIAETLGGEIVSADSRLFYRGMDIGTAKPTWDERARVPHYLVDVANPDAPWSLPRFQEAAARAIAEIQARGKLAMLVGGTGQYIRALIDGWLPPPQPPDLRLREAIERWGKALGPQELHRRLAILDPQAAQFIDAPNLRRSVRALEVIFGTGRRFSEQRRQDQPAYDVFIVGCRRPREELYARVDARIDQMLADGFLEEVRSLLSQGYHPDMGPLSAIGYRELAAHLRGEISLEDAVIRIKRLTRRYIRQQGAWFQESDRRICWYDMTPDPLDRILSDIRSWLNQKSVDER